MDDLISRQAAIDEVDSETVSTNPEHFKGSEKFIKFMDDADIASFGKWQWANGFNTALVATTIQLKKMPSAQPESIRCKECKHRPFDSEDTQGFGVEFPDEKCPCQCDDGWYNWRPNNEWFCANAERREDAEIY